MEVSELDLEEKIKVVQEKIKVVPGLETRFVFGGPTPSYGGPSGSKKSFVVKRNKV